MPLYGLIPFLRSIRCTDIEAFNRGQCPYSGQYHFYLWPFFNKRRFSKVSMPLLGLIPFLHWWTECRTGKIQLVLMPFHELLPFLHIWWSGHHYYGTVCQCPYSGYYHFYPALLKRPIYAGSAGVNSPRFFKNLKICQFLLFFWFFMNFLHCFISLTHHTICV